MRLHKLLADVVIENLREIFSNGKYADKVISSSLKKNPKLGSRDRKFIAQATYDIVRNYRLLYTSSGTKHFWPLLASYFIYKDIVLPDWKEFNGINANNIRKNLNLSQITFPVAQSVPDWLNAMGSDELQSVWEKEMTALNEEAKVIVRVNTLRTTPSQVGEIFKNYGFAFSTHEEMPDALILQDRHNLFSLKEFKSGYFEVQDISSQKVARFMQLDEKQKVIDACAGAGGKSLHIASLMKNKGRIISMDVRENKLEELKRRATRNGVFNIETRVINKESVQDLKFFADRLLLDVPCSGIGVLRRNPDAKWKLTPEKIEDIRKTQRQILCDYAVMLKPGGKLIYSTCSIFPSENQAQINSFLLGNPNFIKEEEKTIYPSEGFDGFYLCRLLRTE